MELFKPSKKILEMICKKREKPLISYEIYLRENLSYNLRGVYNLFFPSLNTRLSEFYRFTQEEEQEYFQYTLQPVEDAFGNCVDHGKGDISIGIFLGSKGVCYGFLDEGDYFKSKKTKSQFENKIPLINLKPKTEHNRRTGVNQIIFPCTDFIEVDSEKGILYFVLLNETVFSK